MDPVQTDDENVARLKAKTEELIRSISPKLKLHDFRIVTGPTHTNLIFDVVVPFKFEKSFEEITEVVNSALSDIDDGKYFAVINYDRDFVSGKE